MAKLRVGVLGGSRVDRGTIAVDPIEKSVICGGVGRATTTCLA